MSSNQTPRTILVVALVVTTAAIVGSGIAVGPVAAGPSASASDSLTVTVENVTDGDTIDVRYDNGTVDTVRLLGVDTPEVHAENTPSEYEGVPNTAAGKECLSAAGVNASQYAKSKLDGATVTLQFDSRADRRGDYGRLLAYVYHGGENFNLDLVRQGHARVYDSTFSKNESFYAAESDAQDGLRGLWHCRSIDDGGDGATAGGRAAIEWIYADASNPNDERVQIKNTRDSDLDLTGYTLTDEAGHTYAFPDGFTLAPGSSVWVHSGRGDDDSNDLYADFGHEVWNDGGDTATLTDASGSTVDARSY